MATERCLADFAGRWHIQRQITPSEGPPATFAGTAIWAPDADTLRYHETGQLTVAGHTPMQSTQRYQWDSALGVWFDDGRYFHSVPPGGGPVRHWCDPDLYVGAYDFGRWPQFEVRWTVTGPRKDYVSVTRYWR